MNITKRTSAREPKSAWPHHRRIIAFCFTAVVGCFVMSASYSIGVMRRVDVSVDDISENVLPRIERLRGLRRHVHDVDQMLSEGADGHPWGRVALERTLGTIDAETAAYVEAGNSIHGAHHEETAWTR